MSGKRAATFPLGLVYTAITAGTAVIGHVILDAGTAAIGKLAANTASTYIGDVVLQAGTAAFGKLAANSGVDIGDVDVTSVAPAASVYDVAEKTDLSTTAFQLASHANAFGTRVSNTSSNGDILYVGGSTATSTRFIQRLAPGESAFFEVNNSNLLYCYGGVSAGSTKFTYGGY
jgi:hypothetical protein